MAKLRVYVLEGKPEEDIAMAMSMCSRSPKPFDEMLSTIDDKKSGRFFYQFYISYGHGSIADTAMIHLAVENISSLAVKVLEDNRLAAYQEKSSRYQIFNRSQIYTPTAIKKSEFYRLYKEAINLLFDLYEKSIDKVEKIIKEKMPPKKDEEEKAYFRRIRIPIIDSCRYLLPTCVYRNVGTTMSGRAVEYAIAKMMSHPLEEVQKAAHSIKNAAKKHLPTLVKYTDASDYLIKTEKTMRGFVPKIVGKKPKDNPKDTSVDLVDYDKDALDKVVRAILSRYSNIPYRDISAKVKKMSQKEKIKIFDKAFGQRKQRFDKPLRELETTHYTFDVTCDYGSYYDLSRHRMTTQTSQLHTLELGYLHSENIDKVGLAREYDEVMKRVGEIEKKIKKKFPYEAQYIVPFAAKKRTIFHFNLREAIYIIELRSRPAGHPEYRRAAQEMWKAINRVHPYFAKHIKVDLS